MTDLSFDAQLRLLGESKSEKFILDTSSAQTIYKGQPVLQTQSVYTDKATAFKDSVTVGATDVCLGIAAEGKSVAAGDPETTEIEVYVWPSIVGFKSSVFTQLDLGKTVYMSDSATLSSTAADNPQIGILHKVEDGYCYVALTTPQVCAGA